MTYSSGWYKIAFNPVVFPGSDPFCPSGPWTCYIWWYFGWVMHTTTITNTLKTNTWKLYTTEKTNQFINSGLKRTSFKKRKGITFRREPAQQFSQEAESELMVTLWEVKVRKQNLGCNQTFKKSFASGTSAPSVGNLTTLHLKRPLISSLYKQTCFSEHFWI